MSSEKTIVITRDHGLHARPALEIVNAVKASGATLTIGASGKSTVSANSLLAVLSQNFAQGTEVVLTATGEGSEALLDRAVEILGEPA